MKLFQAAEGLFQSTLPVGGATQHRNGHAENTQISIHAPRGGSDSWCFFFQAATSISIHAPRGGSDEMIAARPWKSPTFQSTLPVGGATAARRYPGDSQKHFNPRSPWGERQFLPNADRALLLFQSTLPVGGATKTVCSLAKIRAISIHAPRGGSDSKDAQFCLCIFGEKVNFECDFFSKQPMSAGSLSPQQPFFAENVVRTFRGFPGSWDFA